MTDSLAALAQLTPIQKRQLFAAIAKEFVVAHDSAMFPVQDDDEMIGMFIPCQSKAEIISPDEHSPYLDEMRERVKTADRSLSLEEFINRFEADAAAERP